jgi:hypothetical protein
LLRHREIGIAGRPHGEAAVDSRLDRFHSRPPAWEGARVVQELPTSSIGAWA